MRDKLTAKQRRFVDEYLVDFNATQAAIRAGYSAKTARAAAARTLSNVSIRTEIARRQRDLQVRTEVSQDRVVKELMRVAFADMADYAQVRSYPVVNKDGIEVVKQLVTFTKTSALTDDQRASVASIKQGVNGIEVKLWDKLKALELLGRHIGMFNDKLEVKGAIDIASVLAEARGRVSNRGEPDG